MNELVIICRFALATIFAFAAAAKLARRSEFAEAVRNYRLLPAVASQLVASSLPSLELLLGVLLLLGIETVPVAAVAAASLLAFTVAVAVNLLRGRRIECGCFGLAAESQLSWSSVGRNALLFCAALLVAWRPVSVRPGTALAWLVVASAVIAAGGLSHEALRLRRVTDAMRGGVR